MNKISRLINSAGGVLGDMLRTWDEMFTYLFTGKLPPGPKFVHMGRVEDEPEEDSKPTQVDELRKDWDDFKKDGGGDNVLF